MKPLIEIVIDYTDGKRDTHVATDTPTFYENMFMFTVDGWHHRVLMPGIREIRWRVMPTKS